MCIIFRLVILLALHFSRDVAYNLGNFFSRISSKTVALYAARRPVYTSQPQSFRGIDARSIREGSMVEYISAKGSKRLAIVNRRVGAHIEVSVQMFIYASLTVSRTYCAITP